jgi:hypothetical protein
MLEKFSECAKKTDWYVGVGIGAGFFLLLAPLLSWTKSPSTIRKVAPSHRGWLHSYSEVA